MKSCPVEKKSKNNNNSVHLTEVWRRKYLHTCRYGRINPNCIRGGGDKLSHAMQKLVKSACVLTTAWKLKCIPV